MAKKNLKTPSDYPMLAVRTYGQEHKDQLDKLIDRAIKAVNKNSVRPVKKNEVVTKALALGLEKLISQEQKKNS